MAGQVFLSPADAARALGVSAKALRLYEARGLLAPGRTAAGWRAYGPDEMESARRIVALRKLGVSLGQIARVLAGEADAVAPALAAHQAVLEGRLRDIADALAQVRDMRTRLETGDHPLIGEIVGLHPAEPMIAFDLPWPWGGERFELRGTRPLTWITGPLGSGKTRLAECLAAAIPGAVFVGLERAESCARLGEAGLEGRVQAAVSWLVEDGASVTDDLLAVLAALEADGASAIVFDLVEHRLNEATQLALAAHLRRRSPQAPAVFAMTRSSAMLDLGDAHAGEAVIFCPANHAPPMLVQIQPGAPGLDLVASCLAAPHVRARTEGVFAMKAALG